ncbi:DNA circularization N-terminal domain-containing protein [Bradyrhizobium elkanii]|uniref:DNA circularization N-terminal domain-containing protein n=1 Tax=Bradyrhizobium elkanii TaxID=29448 RepID=UPI0004AD2483|nr:DNA circularization N-terminal domain-containing protein [Bradyrhizobium elkanii]WLA79571.1 DNA circularization N-terminal domain-containing protein [Bradyrhizobium elkanii]
MSRHNCAIGKDVVPASFKGVPFYCTEADVEGGRRGAEGEFPFGEDTAYADLGRKIRVYHLTAFFREDDHVSDSGALFAACESPGPGILVHPTRGSVMVACRSIKVSDKIEDEAGQSSAEMEFVEANSIGGFAGVLFGIISSGLNTTSRASFLRDYHPGQASQPWSRDVIDTAQRLVDAVARTTVQTISATASVQDWRDALKIQEVAHDDGLAANGVNVDSALYNGFQIIAQNITDPVTEFKVMRQLANVATHSSALPAGAAMESEEAVLSRHRVLAAIGMAEAAMARTYAYVDEALQSMDAVLAVLEDEAKAAYANCDNGLFLELRKYATEFNRMMNDLAYRLPPMIAVNFMSGVHSLVAAYAIYNDAKRHRDLEARNRIDANGRFSPIVVGVSPG